ncbi:MAG: hypothetical protein WCC11_04110 [Gammaproteobacteria bacterium]
MPKYSKLLIATLAAVGVSLFGAAVPAQDFASAAATSTPVANTAQTESAGSAVLAVGNVIDTAANGSRRQLQDGDYVYLGDAISTGDDSYADLNFEDGGRMLLRPDTDFQIQQYHYDPAAHNYALAPPAEPESYAQTGPAPAPASPTPVTPSPSASAPAQQEHESAFFRLIKGGFRAISGFIGHAEHQDYAVETPVATIGIRGTGYEVRYCDSGCPAGEQGLYTGVGKGAIAVRNQAGESVTTAGHFGYVQNRRSTFRHLQYPPRALQHMQLPMRYRARDQRNFRRIQQHRQQRWQNTAHYRSHGGQNMRAQRYPRRAENSLHEAGPNRRADQMKRASERKAQQRKRKKRPPVRRHHEG